MRQRRMRRALATPLPCGGTRDSGRFTMSRPTRARCDGKRSRRQDTLRLLLRTPAPDLTPAELRLVAGEVVRLEQRLDDARAVVYPRETFAFPRYRATMAAARAADNDGARIPLSGRKPRGARVTTRPPRRPSGMRARG